MKKQPWSYRSPLLEMILFSCQDVVAESEEEKDNTGDWEEEWDEE